MPRRSSTRYFYKFVFIQIWCALIYMDKHNITVYGYITMERRGRVHPKDITSENIIPK